jgi:phage-related tail fiber protein
MTKAKDIDISAAMPKIAQEVAAARGAIAETVSELAAKADARVGDEVKAVKRQATKVGHAVSDELDQMMSEAAGTVATFAERARRNPLPYLAAAGAAALAILIFRSRRR